MGVKEKLRCSACDDHTLPLVLGLCWLERTSAMLLQPSSGRGAARAAVALSSSPWHPEGALNQRDTCLQKKFSSMSNLKLSNRVSRALSRVRREVWQRPLCKCPPGRCGGSGIPPLLLLFPRRRCHAHLPLFQCTPLCPGTQELRWEGAWVKH